MGGGLDRVLGQSRNLALCAERLPGRTPPDAPHHDRRCAAGAGELASPTDSCPAAQGLRHASAYRLSFTVYDIAPAPQHGQLMATRMFCFCSSSRSVRSSLCRVCCSYSSCSESVLYEI